MQSQSMPEAKRCRHPEGAGGYRPRNDGDRRRDHRRRPAAALRPMGVPAPQTVARSTPIRSSRSARSQRCSPRCCMADMVVRGEVAPDDPVGQISARESSRCRNSRASRSRCSIWRPTRRACRACRRISRQRTGAIPTSITRPSGFTTTCRTTSCGFKPGTHYEYANLGFGLLGHTLDLARRHEL